MTMALERTDLLVFECGVCHERSLNSNTNHERWNGAAWVTCPGVPVPGIYVPKGGGQTATALCKCGHPKACHDDHQGCDCNFPQFGIGICGEYRPSPAVAGGCKWCGAEKDSEEHDGRNFTAHDYEPADRPAPGAQAVVDAALDVAKKLEEGRVPNLNTLYEAVRAYEAGKGE